MSSKEKQSDDKSAPLQLAMAPPERAAAKPARFRARIFRAILDRHPDFCDVLRVHGNNLTLKGRYRGRPEDRPAAHRAAAHRSAGALQLACSYSLLKKIDLSLKASGKASSSATTIFAYTREDRDLDAIKSDPRFRQLLRKFDPR